MLRRIPTWNMVGERRGVSLVFLSLSFWWDSTHRQDRRLICNWVPAIKQFNWVGINYLYLWQSKRERRVTRSHSSHNTRPRRRKNERMPWLMERLTFSLSFFLVLSFSLTHFSVPLVVRLWTRVLRGNFVRRGKEKKERIDWFILWLEMDPMQSAGREKEEKREGTSPSGFIHSIDCRVVNDGQGLVRWCRPSAHHHHHHHLDSHNTTQIDSEKKKRRRTQGERYISPLDKDLPFLTLLCLWVKSTWNNASLWLVKEILVEYITKNW